MGTRGHYAFRWRGRHYVYYNHFDSYPRGLGQTIVSRIPTTPEEYRKWLEQLRTYYSKMEQAMEKVYCVTRGQAHVGEMLPIHASGAQDLAQAPDYNSMPECDLWIEWTYIIDLDREIFQVGKSAHFQLSMMPHEKDWKDLLDQAVEAHEQACLTCAISWPLSSGIADLNVHPAVVSGLRPQNSVESSWTGIYMSLNPSIVLPRQHSAASDRPLTIIAGQLFATILSKYQQAIWNAVYTCSTSDRAFQEVAYTLLCVASASPTLLRMGRKTTQTEKTTKAPVGMFSSTPGIAEGPEFASAFLKGYSLRGKGMFETKNDCAYWLLDVLIYLDNDLASETSIQRAVAQAVHRGRKDGRTRFDAIVTSIAHVILLRVTESGVTHTKRLELVNDTCVARKIKDRENYSSEYGGNEESDEEEDNVEAFGQKKSKLTPEMNKLQWVDDGSILALSALANLFESAALETNEACMLSSQGVFPNEIYQGIVSSVDANTGMSCSTVSRAFRDLALGALHLDDHTKLVTQQSTRQVHCHSEEHGDLGPVHIVETQQSSELIEWYALIGSADDTASFIYGCNWNHASLAHNPDQFLDMEVPSEMGHCFDILKSKDLQDEYLQLQFSEMPGGNGREAQDKWAVFEKFLPHQAVVATARDVASVYSIAFFYPLKTMGCISGSGNPCTRSKRLTDIGLVPDNTWSLVGSRGYGPSLHYGLAWSLCPSEDTEPGWEEATQRAKSYATEVFLADMFEAWADSKDSSDQDFAIVIMIGGRCKFFHQRRPKDLWARIAPLSKSYALEIKNRRFEPVEGRDIFGPWRYHGIDIEAVRHDIRDGWMPIFEVSNGSKAIPANVLELSHRDTIEQSFKWIESVAKTRGTKDEIIW